MARKVSLLALIMASFMIASPVVHTQESADQAAATHAGGLFMNPTTDDTWSAAKAIMFPHEQALKDGHEPVAIWLNLRAVYLAGRNRASHVHGLMRDQSRSVQDVLTHVIADGGQVIICGACSAADGLSKNDYIDGTTMGTRPAVEGLIFDPNVATLS